MSVTTTAREPNFCVDPQKLQRLLEHKQRLQEKFPKFGIFLISYHASELLSSTLKRIPSELYPMIAEIFVFDDYSQDDTFEVAKRLKHEENGPWQKCLNIFCNPRNLGYGGNQKVGYRYAIERGLDFVVMLHADGQYAPEFLPDLMLPVLDEEARAEVVFGSRMAHKGHALKGGMPFYKWLGNQVLTRFENFILGTTLSEFHSGYRLYSTRVLKSIAFEENTDLFHFDTEIIIQCRALGVPMHEVPIKTFYGGEVCRVNGMKYAKDVCLSVLDYRLHQLHVVRRTRYVVDSESKCNYTRKLSPYSSHEQILKQIPKREHALALDLGSSNGLLTRSLLEKGYESIGVDIVPPEQVRAPFKEYHQIDLEHSKSMHHYFERNFDVVILADVLEHVRGARALLESAKCFAKSDGKIIISVPNIAIWIYRLSLLLGRFNYGPKGTLDETHVRFYTLATFKQLLDRAGLEVISLRGTSLPFEVVFESSGKSKLLRLLDYCYYQLVLLFPTLFAYQFIAETQIKSFDAKSGEGKV
ncbi:MAG: methyltransferase domain-containing protein [Oligoflexia bacterium]|nr:methyltransferase domain-containing protein [Oligoflexia bacterium]